MLKKELKILLNEKYKTELLELILTFSESEANAYLEILRTMRAVLKGL